MGLYGVPVVLTRSDDRSIHDQDAATLREKKVSDLKNRLALVSELNNAVLLSVHQNSYTDSRYSGAQVFYASSEESKQWAEHTPGAIALGSGRVKRQKRQRDSGHGIFDEPCVLSSHLGGMRLYEQWRGGLSPFDSWVSNENCHGFGRGLCTISPAITGGRRGARWQRKRCFTVQSVETKPCGGRGGVPPAELGIPSWNSLFRMRKNGVRDGHLRPFHQASASNSSGNH